MHESRVPDSELMSDLLRELRAEPRLAQAEILVEVENGTVRLGGSVNSFAVKAAARDAAHRVAGVESVVDQIRVGVSDPFLRSDDALLPAIRSALEWDVFLPSDRIQATAQDGWVVLEGAVDSPEERRNAERLVRSVAGVRGLVNRIEVAGECEDRAEAHRLRSAIEETLRQHAEREAASIGLSVSGGHVLVSGAVHCPQEREEILTSLREAGDELSVEDALVVEGAV